MVDIFLRHICVKHGHIRYGDRKVIHLENIPDMLLSIIHEPVESGICLTQKAQFCFRQSLIKDHIGRLIIIVHHAGGLHGSQRRFLKALSRFLHSSLSLINQAEREINMIILRSFKPSLSET